MTLRWVENGATLEVREIPSEPTDYKFQWNVEGDSANATGREKTSEQAEKLAKAVSASITEARKTADSTAAPATT